MNNIISLGLINDLKQRKYKMIALSSSKLTFNDDKSQKLVCSLAPACDDENFSEGQKWIQWGRIILYSEF